MELKLEQLSGWYFNFFFLDLAGSIVKFDEKGDGPARYTIYNYQKNSKNQGFDYKVKVFEEKLFKINSLSKK